MSWRIPAYRLAQANLNEVLDAQRGLLQGPPKVFLQGRNALATRAGRTSMWQLGGGLQAELIPAGDVQSAWSNQELKPANARLYPRQIRRHPVMFVPV